MAVFTSHQKVMETLNKILQHQLLLLNTIKHTNYNTTNTTIVFPNQNGTSFIAPPPSYTPRISQNDSISFICRIFPQRLQAFLGFALLFLPEFGSSSHLFHLAAQFGDPSNTLKIIIFSYP